MGKLHGEQSSSVSDKECQDRVEELTNGMIMVYNYAQGIIAVLYLSVFSVWLDSFERSSHRVSGPEILQAAG